MNHARAKYDEILPSNNDVLRRSFLSKYAQYDGSSWEIDTPFYHAEKEACGICAAKGDRPADPMK